MLLDILEDKYENKNLMIIYTQKSKRPNWLLNIKIDKNLKLFSWFLIYTLNQ